MTRPGVPDPSEIPHEAGSESVLPATSGGMIDPRFIPAGPEGLFPEAGKPLPQDETGDPAPHPLPAPGKPARDEPEGPKLSDPRDIPGRFAPDGIVGG